jgi:hypothetical protein
VEAFIGAVSRLGTLGGLQGCLGQQAAPAPAGSPLAGGHSRCGILGRLRACMATWPAGERGNNTHSQPQPTSSSGFSPAAVPQAEAVVRRRWPQTKQWPQSGHKPKAAPATNLVQTPVAVDMAAGAVQCGFEQQLPADWAHPVLLLCHHEIDHRCTRRGTALRSSPRPSWTLTEVAESTALISCTRWHLHSFSCCPPNQL